MESEQGTETSINHGSPMHLACFKAKIGRCSLATSCIVWFCVGCGKPSRLTYSEEEAGKVLVPGASRESVEEAFGRPTLLRPTKDGREMAVYEMTDDRLPDAFRHKFTGFDVYYTNDFVERWFPTYSDQTTVTEHPAPQQSLRPESKPVDSSVDSVGTSPGIAFYVVSDTKIGNGNYVNTPALPHVGYIAASPDLAIQTIRSVSKGTHFTGKSGTDREIPVIIISLQEDDAQRMHDVTDRHVGKRLLIVVDREPISAPRISSPIGEGTFSIACRSEQEQEDLVQRLAKLVKQP